MRRILVAAVALTACFACTPDKPRGDTTVLVGRASDALALDPARIADIESSEVTEQLFDHLVRYKADSTEIEPALAESWEKSPDGRVWTFNLRRNVRFHDGTPFDADAVVFSFDRQRDPRHPHHQSDFVYWETNFRNIQSVDKVDSYTVRITIDRPYAPFLANLAMFPVSIVSPAAVRKYGADFARHPVGTGPFRFVEWSPGERIILAANPNYWGGAPHIQHLVFVTIRDARQRLVALEGGAIDVAENLSPEDLQFVALHPELRLLRSSGNNVAYLAMNTQHPPFDDVRVRRAVNYAINKTAIVKLLFQGQAQPATSPVPPSVWGHVDEPLYRYDREEAMKLLAEAHYTRPQHLPKLYVMDTPRDYMPAPETLARMIQHNLRDVGMDVEVVVNDIDTDVRLTQNGQHDLCLLGWSADAIDPDNFLYVLFDSDNAEPGSARNLAFFKNAELHGILAWAQESSDRAERERYYKKAQEIIAKQAPWVPLAHGDSVVAVRASLGGLQIQPLVGIYFQPVYKR